MVARRLIFYNVCVIMQGMSVREVLPYSDSRSRKGFDYVDENGDVQFATIGDEAVFEEYDRPEASDANVAAEQVRKSEAAARRQLDMEADRVVDEADKRGISVHMARLALGVSDPVVRKKTTARQHRGSSGRSKGRGGNEPVSSRLASMEIDMAQAQAEQDLGRGLTDEEMTAIASDVMRRLRKG